MRTFTRPIVIISKCLEFAACRYNGLMVSSPVVRLLTPLVEFRPVCPEVEIGLGVPRDPIRIIESKSRRSLYQPASGRDVTDAMNEFTRGVFSKLGEADGFILKTRSPSCGIKDVKVYPGGGAHHAPLTGKGAGFFGGAVVERLPGLAIEDEGRLENYNIREHFFTKLYTLADFRQVAKTRSPGKLVDFQSRHKLLLMAYSQKEMRALGVIAAAPEKLPWDTLAAEYRAHLQLALSRMPRATAHINVMMHALGYFKDELSPAEKDFFLDQLTEYRREKLPLSAVIAVMRSWVVRFRNEYLGMQTYFEPYPESLSAVSDSGKGREL